MKFRIALTATTLLIVSGAAISVSSASAADISNIFQGMSGNLSGWSDFDTKKSELSKLIENGFTSGQLSDAQTQVFRKALNDISTSEATAKASGKGRFMGFVDTLNFNNQLNALANQVQVAMEQHVASLPDVETLQVDLRNRIQSDLSSGRLSTEDGSQFSSELTRIAGIESAYKAETDGKLTPRQVQLLADDVNRVKTKLAEQEKLSESGIPIINQRRAAIEKEIEQANTSGRLNAEGMSALRRKMAQIADKQTQYQSGNQSLLTGAQIFSLARDYDSVESDLNTRIALVSPNAGQPGWSNQSNGYPNQPGSGGWPNQPGSGGFPNQSNSGGWPNQPGSGNFPNQPGGFPPAPPSSSSGAPGSGLNRFSRELDNLSDRVNRISRKNWLPSADVDDLRQQIDDATQLIASFNSTPGGITDVQGRTLANSLGRIKRKVEGAEEQGKASESAAAGAPANAGPAVSTSVSTRLENDPSYDPGAIPNPTKSFGDTAGYWGQSYIESLAGRNIIGGFPDGTFHPNDPITRAQFAAIIVQALQLPQSSSGSVFTDVPATSWAKPAIAAASNAGLITGFPDGTFGPTKQITRAQSLVILAKALKTTAKGNRKNAPDVSNYSDAAAVPQWAAKDISEAAKNQIIVNFPDTHAIRPNELATRGEVAGMVYQTLLQNGMNLPRVYVGVNR